MRYQVTAHVFDEHQDNLLAAVRFEVDAGSLFLAHDDALIRLRDEYPGKTIEVTAKELDAERDLHSSG